MENILNRGLCRAARALLNLSQQQLAERAGLSKKTLADYERGATMPQARTVRDLEVALQDAGIEFIVEVGRTVGIRTRK